MKINKYLPLALIYFFINSLGLPFGLTYTTILSPLLYWWVITNRKAEILLPFFVILTPFIIIHFINGVNTGHYFISLANYTAVYIFCHAFYTFLKTSDNPETIFRKLFYLNFMLCLAGILIYFTSYKAILWSEQSITTGIDNFSRLKLFTYEASYYAVIFTPIFFFYLMQLLLDKNKINSWLLLLMFFLPYLLSFSIGAIAAVLFSGGITYIIYFKRLTRKKNVLRMLVLTGCISVSSLFIVWLFFPQNSLFLRLDNIFSGNDTSGNGRTSDAFILALKILDLKSVAWGVGAGQIKLLGADIIRSYYLYPMDYNTFAIPNAAAETLTIFGWIGFTLRIVVEVFLFFITGCYCLRSYSYTSSQGALLPIVRNT